MTPNPTPETLEVMLNEIHKAKGQFVGWALFIRRLRAHLVSWRADRKRLEAYDELIYAVERKHEGETRHETALRYIREAEAKPSSGPFVAALAAGEKKP